VANEVLVIGAGLAGCSAAAKLRELGVNVVVWEATDDIGGLCADSFNAGSYVQWGGPHFFHTKYHDVWEWVNRWERFVMKLHYVGILVEKKVVPLPFNERSDEILGARWSDEQILNYCFKPYSEKMWGKSWEALPENITRRVMQRNKGYDCRYFNTPWQGVPVNGYTNMMANMLEGVTVEMNHTATILDIERWNGPVIYTGIVDSLMDFKFGVLPYRGVRVTIANPAKSYVPDMAGAHAVKIPNVGDDTLCIANYSEFCSRAETLPPTYGVVLADGENSRTYPLRTAESERIYSQYANVIPQNVILAGRQGGYRYLNMDEAILSGIRAAALAANALRN